MGLFGRFRTSQTLGAGIAAPQVALPEPRHLRVVPDIAEDTSEFEESVRSHLERLSAAADADLDSLSRARFDAALTSTRASARCLCTPTTGWVGRSPA